MKNKTKQTLILILLVVFVITALFSVACSGNTLVNNLGINNKDEFHLYSNAITIEQQETFQIEFDKSEEEQITFESENQNVATVSSTGLVTGVDKGVTVIKVSNGQKSVNCKVTVVSDDSTMILTCEKLTLVVGSEKEVVAKMIDGDKEIDAEIVWGIDKSESITLCAKENVATVKATATGDYVLSATYKDIVKQCAIRVISNNTTRLTQPELKVDGCKNLTWSTIDGAKAYAVSVDGVNWTETTELTYDVTSITDKLLDGDKNEFFVKALAKDNYDLLDSYISNLTFEHEYTSAYTQGKEATCTQFGEINYTCQNCDKKYTDDKYIEEHQFESWKCKVCGTYRSNVVYGFDDNYIPIPTDTEVSFKLKFAEAGVKELDATFKAENADAWKVKYFDYYKDDVSLSLPKENSETLTEVGIGYSSQNLWEAVEKNKHLIPEEQRQPCYYFNALENSSVKEVYVAGYWYNPDLYPDPLPVKYVGMNAFAYNRVIEKVVFSKETTEFRGVVFDNSRVKKVIAPGLTYLHYYQGKSNDFTQTMNFRNCFSLTTLVVGEDFVSKGRQFYWWYFKSPWFDGHVAQINIYIDREYNDMSDFELDLNKGAQLYANDMLTGNYYFKDSTGTVCDTWRYNEDQTDIIFNAHNFANGKCTKCNADDPKGVNYCYDSEKDCYYVGVANYSGKVIVKSHYNDGIHGVKPVTYVDRYAFHNCLKGSHKEPLTHLYLPETVTEVGSFELCRYLEVLSMPGVEVIDVQNGFLDCVNLHTLIVGDKLSVSKQCFYVRNDNPNVPYAVGYEPSMTIYSTSATGASVKFAASVDNMWNGIVKPYCEGALRCNTWCFDKYGYSIIEGEEHEYLDDYCVNCGQQDPKGFVYVYNEDADGYCLKSAPNASGVVIVPKTYNDGVHGEKKIVEVAGAFSFNNDITHVYLPESVTKIGSFSSSSSLKLVSMPGVTRIEEINVFLDCYKLESVIIGEKLYADRQCFYVRNNEPLLPHLLDYVPNSLLTFYTVEESASVTLCSPLDNMWNGKIIPYSEGAEACGSWCFGEDGYSIVVGKEHNFVDGICENCHKQDGLGIDYAYDSQTDSYYVRSATTAEGVVRIFATYNDGVNGEKPVTHVSNTAFAQNKKITHVFLPESVVYPGKYEVCSNLELIYMPGVTKMYQNDMGSGNQFLDCPKLTSIIVGSQFMSDGQVFYDRHNGGNYMTVYTTAEKGAIIRFTGQNNNMWNGKVVYYGENGACGSWSWADETKTSITVNEGKHSFDATTGICKHCNKFNDCGLTYTLNEQGTAYSVTAWDGITSVVKIYPEYKELPVTAIEGKPFNNSLNALTELYMAETITELPVMEQCFGLKVLAIPGVKTLGTGNHLLGCRSLEALIVGSEFSTTVASVLYSSWNYSGYTGPIMTIYTTQATPITPSIAQGEKSTAWNGIVGCYDENLSAENTWRWADEQQIGISIYTAE